MNDKQDERDREQMIKDAREHLEDMERVLFLLDPVATRVEREFRWKFGVVDVQMLGETGFVRAMVFYKTNDDVMLNQHNGGSHEIVEFIYDNLERVGFGKRADIRLVVEFESEENVKLYWNGDFTMPMR